MGRASEYFIVTVSPIIDLFLDLGVQKCKSFFVAAAPISNETLAYFMSLDIRIFDIYGMSECAGPQTFNCKEYQVRKLNFHKLEISKMEIFFRFFIFF